MNESKFQYSEEDKNILFEILFSNDKEQDWKYK
jgi:hypothetical protein